MNIPFYKYHGAGNDFIIIDNRESFFPIESHALINSLCDRNKGIGSDGLILLENDKETDFKMLYFNADGNQGTMCGNGGRCIVAFAKYLGIIQQKTEFMAVDGIHQATIENGLVSLKMIDVDEVQINDSYIFTDTGSPHHIKLIENIHEYPVIGEGRKIRNELYGKEGSNVNFVEQIKSNEFQIRTYERGVEDETLACGTGAVAAAIAMHQTGATKNNSVVLYANGGTLEVSFETIDNKYTNVFLKGPATYVFKGTIDI